MTKVENRCTRCGRKFGLVSHRYWDLRFCSKGCKDNFLAKAAKEHADMRKWFGLLARKTTR